ncbi:2,4-dihydroxyhept-2-ene-1,7-dioic acid aldolase [Mycolicibacterium canariasense]|uniref:2,4-dihydroxyhept-2-ene-1,7-dioic acid aldolase n=1 Tax=Mycolicibacterium canariasense TaxID=228230 RepID=A0A100W9K3_MYCCR|nr:hypothetical protein [Mycolicibacterium canariasense]MCV7208810.1 hypothetical protein [Mycolicibacterium canariasense]ORV07125.1 hypothetical protein AWB94_14075 [Mycolicibacterium canariasense]GAS94402.1 2,4-dihydroxyhept-2-ene-1,7-dioic acid aldolase [Mycolicibacterium canariasense]
MALNRRQRRARVHHRPVAGDTPSQQMKALLKQPGKFHIVELPEGKSFVVKVTDREMPLFTTMCLQLRGVLGYCEVRGATPVDASIADIGTIARQTANDPARLRIAQERTDAAARAGCDNPDEVLTGNVTPDADAELDAAIARHPAGKKRASGGRHAKPEPDTVFDQLAAGAGDEDTARRLAAMELAAAHDEVRKAGDALDDANRRLAEVYERAGELHNRHVLDKFTEQASEAISDKLDAPRYTPDDGPPYELGRDFTVADRYPAPAPDRIDNIDTARQSAIDEALRQAHADANRDDNDSSAT